MLFFMILGFKEITFFTGFARVTKNFFTILQFLYLQHPTSLSILLYAIYKQLSSVIKTCGSLRCSLDIIHWKWKTCESLLWTVSNFIHILKKLKDWATAFGNPLNLLQRKHVHKNNHSNSVKYWETDYLTFDNGTKRHKCKIEAAKAEAFIWCSRDGREQTAALIGWFLVLVLWVGSSFLLFVLTST